MKTILFVLLVPLSLLAKDPVFTIKTKTSIKTFKSSELLKRKDLEKIKLVNSPAYKKKTIIVSAVPVANLFKDISVAEDEVIIFKALDGFSAPLSRDRLLNQDKAKAIAYVAIEWPEKWPKLSKRKPSAGPFYLVWENPKASQIVSDEWPFMLSSLEVSGTLKSMYPKIFPKTKNLKVAAGFKHYLKNCLACHKINGQGTSNFGPDLNKPMNPVEYFKPSALKKYIREPKSVRTWSGLMMPGFAKKDLSDKDINDLISYLRHMSKHKN